MSITIRLPSLPWSPALFGVGAAACSSMTGPRQQEDGQQMSVTPPDATPISPRPEWEPEPELEIAWPMPRRRERRPVSVPGKDEMARALEVVRSFLEVVGSAWENVPAALRGPMLAHAHEIEELLIRDISQASLDRDQEHLRRRRVQLRHRNADMNALGLSRTA